MIITIDGLAATGKSTLAKSLSKKLNFFYINSGAIFRSYAYILCLLKKINFENEELINKEIEKIEIEYLNTEEKEPIILFENINIFNNLNNENIAFYASKISSYKKVRIFADKLQRDLFKKNKKIIADGRDCGIKVFPAADLKIFLTAFHEEREKRILKRENLKINELSKIIESRDKNDFSKKISPSIPSFNAFIIDTTKINTIFLKNYCLNLINLI